MAVYTTEIASQSLVSDNPIHQRLLVPYYYCSALVKGDLLEIGCGEGRGVEVLGANAASYTGVDKIGGVITGLREKYPQHSFYQMVLPPMRGLEDESFDTIVSFQVIEHIKDDLEYLREIRRLLKPGGKAYITTPNIKQTLTRNPWHVREYTAEELQSLAARVFTDVKVMGITGNDRVMAYYYENKKSVEKITRWDFLNLQYRLPAFLLRLPYDILNRMNRKKLQSGNSNLVSGITHNDYPVTPEADEALDLFCILTKA